MKRICLASLLFVLAVCLTGCNTLMIEPTEKQIDQNADEGKELLFHARKGDGAIQPNKRPFVEKNPGIWISSHKISDRDTKTTVGRISEINISVNRRFNSPLEFAERITALTGIPVSVSPDLYGKSRDASPGQASTGISPVVPSLSGNSGGSLFPDTNVYLTYDGSLAGFLDVASARYGISWRWTGKEINLFRYLTKTFRINTLPGDTNLQNTISNQTGNSNNDNNSTSGGSGAQAASASGGSISSSGVTISNLSVWTGIKETIKDMLSADGKVSISPATGTVTVTDIPVVIDAVEKFVNDQNNSLNKQVTVNVKVLAVELSDGDEYGINWNMMYQNVSRSLSLGLTGAFEGAVNANNLTASILPGGSSPWANSQAILSALSKQGKVSQITSASLTTLNNQPAPLQVGNQRSYLAASTTTIAQGVGATTTLQPGLVTTGFSMSLVPHILSRGKMLLQFSINISSLLSLTQVTSGNSTIQTPEVNTRNFLQRIKIHKGETLVLTGFEQLELDTSSQGVGSAHNVMLGGGVSGKNTKTILVILIQPM